LQDVPEVYRTKINDVLLTALAHAFAKWTGQQRLLINLEGHGREDLFEDVDLSRTVGWFTSIFPVLLDIGGATDLGRALKKVKEQLRAIPKNGVEYGILRYLSETQELSDFPEPEVSFNYLGQLDHDIADTPFFQLAPERAGQSSSLKFRRRHLIDVNGHIAQGRLKMRLNYNSSAFDEATMQMVADCYMQALRDIIIHCSQSEGGFTVSDFSLI